MDKAVTPLTYQRVFHNPAAAERAGAWCKAVLFGDGEAVAWCKQNGVAITRAASEGLNTAGGFLVPTEFETAIVSLRERYGTFRRFARRVPMASDLKNQPLRTGGAQTYFVAEGQQITESTVGYDSAALSAKKLAALVKASTELVDDSPADVAEDLAAEFGEAFARQEDLCGWNGDGTSPYGGMVGITQLLIDGGHDAGKVTAASGHDTFAEIDAADLTNLMSKLPVRAIPGAAWWASQVGAALTFYRLAAAAGGIIVVDGEPTYLNFPIRLAQSLPQSTGSLSGQCLLAFGNLRMSSMFGDRRGLRMAESDRGSTFETDQILFKGIEQFDIVNNDLGNNDVAGAMVGLVGD